MQGWEAHRAVRIVALQESGVGKLKIAARAYCTSSI
jgi:hypothetical protein